MSRKACVRPCATGRIRKTYVTSLPITPTGGTPEELAAFLRRAQTTAVELSRIVPLKFD